MEFTTVSSVMGIQRASGQNSDSKHKTSFTSPVEARGPAWTVVLHQRLAEGTSGAQPRPRRAAELCARRGRGGLGKPALVPCTHTGGILYAVSSTKAVTASLRAGRLSPLLSPVFPEPDPRKWARGRRGTMSGATPDFWEDSVLCWEPLEGPGEKLLYKCRHILASPLNGQENSVHTATLSRALGLT